MSIVVIPALHVCVKAKDNPYKVPTFYYIPITDTTLELSVFWPSDTEAGSTN